MTPVRQRAADKTMLRHTFREIRTNTAHGLRWFFLLESRLSCRRFNINTAGARSHVVKHPRDATGQP